jgi:hypothetical protein
MSKITILDLGIEFGAYREENLAKDVSTDKKGSKKR